MNSNGMVIAGGGLAGQRCCERLRRRGYEGRIRMVCDEPHQPYDRPPLSKEHLAGAEPKLAFRDEDWYRDHDVELLLGTRATGLEDGVLATSAGPLPYDKLLIATGAAPRHLPGAERFSNSHVLRTLADATELREALRPGARLVVIGAGFIGLEVAATARKLGVEVTLIDVAPAPLAHILGARIGSWFAGMHADEGVHLELSKGVDELRGNGRVEELKLSDGSLIECDVLLVAIGVAPTLGWLGGIDPGSLPDVHVAGDAAGGEHWEAAALQGGSAADEMLGLSPGSAPLTSFWSDQYGVRIQYLGDARHSDAVELDGSLGRRDFSVTFTQGGRPVAALLVGRPRALPEMRRLIAKGTPDELPD
jgi:3-phenylpropionate/trans-cinnamate dioxygenase ferredoxin reductase component